MTGSSMEPLLQHIRDRVEIVPPDRIRKGDIVLFDRKSGRYALHRVIRKQKNGFTMAGDNQHYFEKDLLYEQVVGVVSTIERNGKRIDQGNFLLKMYTFAVTTLTFPRIYLWKAKEKLLKPFRHSGNLGKKRGKE